MRVRAVGRATLGFLVNNAWRACLSLCPGALCVASYLSKAQFLKGLDLTNNDIGDAGLTALSSALPAIRALRVLRLDKNAFRGQGVRALAVALRSLPFLRILSLADNYLEDPVALNELGASLSATPHLVELSFRNCRVCDDGERGGRHEDMLHPRPHLPFLAPFF